MSEQPICINGKYSPMWSQFVHGKDKWIGGELVDSGDSMDRAMGFKPRKGIIIDVILRENGVDSAWFCFLVEWEGGDVGECGGDVSYIGISDEQEGEPWLWFAIMMGHKFKVKKAK